jgi:5-formyltetrahydrofolate cyclo-ligase
VEAAARRRAVWQKSGAEAARDVAAQGLKLIETFQNLSVAGGYFPIRDELDPLDFLTAVRARGIRIALPQTRPGPDLAFAEWLPGSALAKGRFGIPEPAAGSPEAIPDIVLVPLLAFDRRGGRLGYGAGYYDAALRRLRGGGLAIAIGIAFDEQELAAIPQEPQDERLDMILTPSRIVACGD